MRGADALIRNHSYSAAASVERVISPRPASRPATDISSSISSQCRPERLSSTCSCCRGVACSRRGNQASGMPSVRPSSRSTQKLFSSNRTASGSGGKEVMPSVTGLALQTSLRRCRLLPRFCWRNLIWRGRFRSTRQRLCSRNATANGSPFFYNELTSFGRTLDDISAVSSRCFLSGTEPARLRIPANCLFRC